MVHHCGAYEFIVGGQKGWSVPSDPNSNPYSQWAQKSRFQIGDSLGKFLFKIKHVFIGFNFNPRHERKKLWFSDSSVQLQCSITLLAKTQ